MTHKKHKNVTVLLGAIFLVSLSLNIVQILLHNPRYFIDMFRCTKDVGIPWIAYISLASIFLSAIGAAGLAKYRRWGFYGMYISYLAGASVAWFPFFPRFIFPSFIFPDLIVQPISGTYVSIMSLILLLGFLGLLVHLHLSGKKYGYFDELVAPQNDEP